MYALNTNQFSKTPTLKKALGKLHPSNARDTYSDTSAFQAYTAFGTAVIIPLEHEPIPDERAEDPNLTLILAPADYQDVQATGGVTYNSTCIRLAGYGAGHVITTPSQTNQQVMPTMTANIFADWAVSGNLQTTFNAVAPRVIQWFIVNTVQMDTSSEDTYPIPVEVITATATNAQIEKFLQDIYGLDTTEKRQAAIDHVFDYIDRLFWKDEFFICDTILRRLNTSRLSPSLLRSFLVITNAAKEKLPSRNSFFLRVREEIVEKKGEAVARRLLNKLA